mgnify:CR=1 FL=1
MPTELRQERATRSRSASEFFLYSPSRAPLTWLSHSFAKGDLALFLPTRNSTVPVWAAFNVSFPHHFLAATGIISEQMKSREWIVARITSLTEKVADAKASLVSLRSSL